MAATPPILNFVPSVSINDIDVPVFRWHCTRPAYGSVGAVRLYLAREAMLAAGINIYQIGVTAKGQVPIKVSVRDLDKGVEHLLFGGELDSIDVDYDSDVVIVNGRDWAGLLVDEKGSPAYRQTFQVGSNTPGAPGVSNSAAPCNSAGKVAPTGAASTVDATVLAVDNGVNVLSQTPSSLAYMIAVRNGFNPIVYATPNEIMLGDIFGAAGANVTEAKPWWDWLQFAARMMGWACYVTPERSLYFGPFDMTNIAHLSWGANAPATGSIPCRDLHITYNPRRNSSFLVLVGGVDHGTAEQTVGVVATIDPGTLKTLQEVYPQVKVTNGKYIIGAAGAQSPFSLAAYFSNLGKPVYYYNIQNLTANQAAAKAFEYMLDIAKRELVLKTVVDGNPSIVPMQTVNLEVVSNAPTDFPNTQYYVNGVEHTYSIEEGWYTHISAWTLPPVTTTQFLAANNINGVSMTSEAATLYVPPKVAPPTT